MDDISLHSPGPSSPPPRLRNLQCHRSPGLIVPLESQICKICQSRSGLHECCHTPLSKPSLKCNVASIATNGGGREGGLLPEGGNSWCGFEECAKLLVVETAVVVFVEEEEEIDKETVADGTQFCRCELGDFESGKVSIWV